jgi:hypothetical protein
MNTFQLEMHISTPKLGIWGIIPYGCNVGKTTKTHILVPNRLEWYMLCKGQALKFRWGASQKQLKIKINLWADNLTLKEETTLKRSQLIFALLVISTM